MPIFTLDKMVPGESGRILSVHGRGPVRRRLVDMGLTRGAVIDMVKTSPLGDPVEYRLRGYHLSLRKSEARTIEVELLIDSRPRSTGPGPGRSVLPLVRCRNGQQVEIVRARGGRGQTSRLREMGLQTGMVLDIVQNEFPGPIVLSIKGGERLIVGKGMARHILVQPL